MPPLFLLEARAKDSVETRLLDGQAQSNAGNSDSDALFIIKTETEIYLA